MSKFHPYNDKAKLRFELKKKNITLIKVFRPLNTFRSLIEAHLSTITSSNHCVYHAKHMKRRLHQTFN